MSIQDLRKNPDDLRKLARILDMTSSDYDGEVLAAVRKARSILSRYDCSFDDLVSTPGMAPRVGQDRRELARLHMLERQLRRQKAEISRLEGALKKAAHAQESSPAADKPRRRFWGSVSALRGYLLRHFSLRAHEVKLLEQLHDTDIRPNSKEAYLVLICARRYGVQIDD